MHPSAENLEFLHCQNLTILVPVDLLQTIVFNVVPIYNRNNTAFMLKQVLFIEDSLRFNFLNYMKHNKYAKEFLSSTAEINYHNTKSSAVCYVPTIHKVMAWMIF